MVPKLGDEQEILFDFIDNVVLVVYSAGLITRQAMFEGLGLPDVLERRTLNFLDEGVYPFKDFSVRTLPVEIVFPSML